MSNRYPGGVLSSTAPTTTNASATGIWTEQSLLQKVATGNWPRSAGAPTIGTATAGSESASVTFTGPSEVGTGTLTYTVTSSPGSITATGSASPITVSGLTNGTAYTFTVTASTPGGTSPSSEASNSVTPFTPVYVEDVYSTYIYGGNGGTQTITNNINLATNGGLTWVKCRNETANHVWNDTVRGAGTGSSISTNKGLTSNLYDKEGGQYARDYISAFSSTGFSVTAYGPAAGSNLASTNESGRTYVSWSFRKQAKFFDIVTYTGNGATGRSISHSLGVTPGLMFVKNLTDNSTGWVVYSNQLGYTQYLLLNTNQEASGGSGYWYADPTSSQFYVSNVYGDSWTNGNGKSYVAYLFASSNAGGFGASGNDSVIATGSYSGNDSTSAGPVITLGWEPQWVMIKRMTGGLGEWKMMDSMRVMTVEPNDYFLEAQSGSGESQTNLILPTATGFNIYTSAASLNASGSTYLYMAIRRGLMKTPTVGTSVFAPVTLSAAEGTRITTTFPPDTIIFASRPNGYNNFLWEDRLRGYSAGPTGSTEEKFLQTNKTAAETSTYNIGWYSPQMRWDNTGSLIGRSHPSISNVWWNFKRAPSFFDTVCYTGVGGAGVNWSHNLGVAPEFMIIKRRNASDDWAVYHNALTASNVLQLNTTIASTAYSGYFNNTAPTASVFTTGSVSNVNSSGSTYVAYLFATCAGVSKVGSYTGTGALQTINCGFTTGARFILIKRTDSTGDWNVWDSARGISSGNDPYIYLNDPEPTAEVTGTNYVDTTSVGFQVTAAAPASVNASGGTYIFLAIA
jgi:hypothetical protein